MRTEKTPGTCGAMSIKTSKLGEWGVGTASSGADLPLPLL